MTEDKRMEEKRTGIWMICFTTLVMLLVVGGRIASLQVWNHQKVFAIGVSVICIACFGSSLYLDKHSTLRWTSYKCIIALAGTFAAMLCSYTGVKDLAPILLPVAVIAMLSDGITGISYGLFFVHFLYYSLIYQGRISGVEWFEKYSVLTICICLIAGQMRNFARLIYCSVALFFSGMFMILFYESLMRETVSALALLSGAVMMFVITVSMVVSFFVRRLLEKELMQRDGVALYKELREENNPMLVKYKEEAPASYAHAKQLAEFCKGLGKIQGLDVELLQTGAMYHEIGKAFGKDYVSFGIAYCKENEVPVRIQDFIVEHGCKIKSPSTVESAVVMLADSVWNTLQYVREKKLSVTTKDIVKDVFEKRKSHGDLNKCGMTLGQYEELLGYFLEETDKW